MLGEFTLGWGFVPLAVLVVVGSSNAVNLTDGLDGLAGGCLVLAAGALGIIAYVGGHAQLAEYLHVMPVAGSHEILVVIASLSGGVLGFLWFNCHPAQVFMGDTGSLPLGGLLGLAAVITRQELLLLVVGGVFVAEAVSVIVQVGCFKLTGRRPLLCAPLHHHFQFRGWTESKIVVRFWIAAAVCALVGLAGLKLPGSGSRQNSNRFTSDREIPASSPQSIGGGMQPEFGRIPLQDLASDRRPSR
jgi:phospho-N-acetylmuramoyl-pentapeptide-transferase